MQNLENYKEEFEFLSNFPIVKQDDDSYIVVVNALKAEFGFNYDEARDVLNLFSQNHSIIKKEGK